MFRGNLRYVSAKSSNKPELTKIPPLPVTGIEVAKVGIVAWGVAMVLAWVFRTPLSELGLPEAAEIATAGFVLGLIGLRHVTRRARRLGQIQ